MPPQISEGMQTSPVLPYQGAQRGVLKKLRDLKNGFQLRKVMAVCPPDPFPPPTPITERWSEVVGRRGRAEGGVSAVGVPGVIPQSLTGGRAVGRGREGPTESELRVDRQAPGSDRPASRPSKPESQTIGPAKSVQSTVGQIGEKE